MRRARDPQRLGLFQTVAAWLRLWTPPREAVVAPVPWLALALGAALLALALTGAALLIVPAIDEGKSERAASERKRDAARRSATVRRLAEEGRPRSGSLARPPDLARLGPAARRRVRRTLVRSLEGDIVRDARARVRRRKLKGPISAVRCTIEPPSQRFIERDLGRPAADYDCLAITRRGRGGRFLVGHPFRARVDYRRLRYSWRRVCLPPGEGALRLSC